MSAAPVSKPDMRELSEGELAAALRRPEAYPHPVEQVGAIETHISRIFLAGDRVYKLKKPVNLGFVDYSTPESRLHFCEEELRLNRRLAPDTYLGVVPIVQTPEGLVHVGPDIEGRVLEHAVMMERLPDERMLGRLLERGEVDNDLVERIVKCLVRFHREALTGPEIEEFGSVPALRDRIAEDLADLDRFAGTTVVSESCTISHVLHEFLGRKLHTFLDSNAELFQRRVRQGRIREGHGDLHAGNICYQRHETVIYDCIEFSAALRCGDVASDVAFLAMDLDFRGFRGFSRYLVRRYAQLSDDPELPALMDFYKTQRAIVRGKVESLRAAETGRDADQRLAARLLAERYFHLAASYHLPTSLILMCGLPATGKSWMAQHLAAPFEALVLRSDVRRKTLAGLSPQTHTPQAYGTGLYSPESIEHTYQALLDEALGALDLGRTVIVDATFSTAARRRRFLDAATRLGHPVALVHVSCDEDVVHLRLQRRAGEAGQASDADWEVYQRAAESFEEPEELNPRLVVEASHTDRPEHTTGRVIDKLVRQADTLAREA